MLRAGRISLLALFHTCLAEEPACEAAGGCGLGAKIGWQYPWSKRGGNDRGASNSPNVAPTDFSKPAWVWPNEGDELFRHGAVIDNEGNVYSNTAMGYTRKFDPDGRILWTHRTSEEEGRSTMSLALAGGRVYFTSRRQQTGDGGYAWCLDMETGNVLWKAKTPYGDSNGDSATVSVVDSVFMYATTDYRKQHAYEGNDKIVGLNASDGSFIWEYLIDGVVWNWQPSTVGDGSIIFSSCCGKAHKVNIGDGKLIWKAAIDNPDYMCGTAGGALDDSGIFWAYGNYGGLPEGKRNFPVQPCTPGWCPHGAGLLVGYRASDGEILFAERLPFGKGGVNYPAIGVINGRATVVAPIGENPGLVFFIFDMIFEKFGKWIGQYESTIGFVFIMQMRYKWLKRMLKPHPFENSIVAMDAKTRQVLWRFDDEPWDMIAAKGDEEGFIRRDRHMRRAHEPMRNVDTICGPDALAIPVIAADGTVYAASGTGGNMYAIKDANDDGVIDESEYSTFNAESATLNGPALGPGMLVHTPCWGPMYVFKGQPGLR